jgi:hypothetical protein
MGHLKANHSPITFNVHNEAHKLLHLLRKDPPKLTMRHDDEDLQMLPFADYQIGFFVMLLRGQRSSVDDNFTYIAVEGREAQANELMGKLNVQQLEPGILMATSGCSWDVAKRKFAQSQNVQSLAVAFTTPFRLQILSESPMR